MVVLLVGPAMQTVPSSDGDGSSRIFRSTTVVRVALSSARRPATRERETVHRVIDEAFVVAGQPRVVMAFLGVLQASERKNEISLCAILCVAR